MLSGAGEMAQYFRALTDLVEDLGLVASSHPSAILSPVLEDLMLSSCLHDTAGTIYTNIYASNSHVHEIKINTSLKRKQENLHSFWW